MDCRNSITSAEQRSAGTASRNRATSRMGSFGSSRQANRFVHDASLVVENSAQLLQVPSRGAENPVNQEIDSHRPRFSRQFAAAGKSVEKLNRFIVISQRLVDYVRLRKGIRKMADVFLGSLLLVPYNFAPNGWMFCNGQLLPISQYSALFSLIGTTYGGDGVSNFALPDLRGRVPNSAGQGPGLANYNLGDTGGAENTTLSSSN